MTVRIFLSHSHEDNVWCDNFVSALSKYDVSIWYDRQSLEIGGRWIQNIENGFANTDIFLIIITPDSWKSYFVQLERDLAIQQQKQIIGIFAKETEVEGFMNVLQMMNCVGKEADEVAELLAQRLKLTRLEHLEDKFEGTESQPVIISSLNQQGEEVGQVLQRVSVLEPQSLLGNLPATIAVDQKIAISDRTWHRFKKSIFRNRRLLLSVIIILVLFVSLVPFIPFPACIGTFCRSSQHSTNQQSGAAQALAFSLVDIVSPSFVLPGDPHSYTANKSLPDTTGAVLIAKNSASYYTLIVNVRNLRTTGPNILIDYIALKIQQIPAVPRPLRVWTRGVATTYNTYPYPVTYKGQTPGQLLYAVPPQNVELKNGEDNQISVQIQSAESVYLQFQVQVAYQLATSTTVSVLKLPQTFQVVFSDASNWQQYILQNGTLVEKS